MNRISLLTSRIIILGFMMFDVVLLIRNDSVVAQSLATGSMLVFGFLFVLSIKTDSKNRPADQ
ncbi:hypothetical protein [Lentibacillus halophilus]|uniref:hypothetical protein n=1 Tax=Lentibacillus halophilus TaxID=295065 RepID=UPI0031CFF59B